MSVEKSHSHPCPPVPPHPSAPRQGWFSPVLAVWGRLASAMIVKYFDSHSQLRESVEFLGYPPSDSLCKVQKMWIYLTCVCVLHFPLLYREGSKHIPGTVLPFAVSQTSSSCRAFLPVSRGHPILGATQESIVWVLLLPNQPPDYRHVLIPSPPRDSPLPVPLCVWTGTPGESTSRNGKCLYNSHRH